MRVASWRVALRIARREARRARGRSLLVISMIGLPILALTFAAVTVRTAQLPPEEAARREIGAADLRAVQVSDRPVRQDSANSWSSEGAIESPVEVEDAGSFLARLPAGSRIVASRAAYGLRLRAPDGGVAIVDVREVPSDEPIVEGMVRLRSGRMPATRDEVALTPSLLARLGVRVGDAISTATQGESARTLAVTGVAVVPQELGSHTVISRPGSGLRASDDHPAGGGNATSWLVDLPSGASDLAVMRTLNKAGYAVSPRTWYVRPPDTPGTVVDPATVGVVLVAVGLAALEIVLLAGAAFAVGARRRRRELGVLVAAGAARADVVRTVLAGGVVLGAVAGVLGVLGGVVLVAATRSRLERVNGALLGPLDLRPLELAAIVGVAVGTAVLAALLPARAAARASVVGSLTGRRGEVRTARRVPLLGIVAVFLGAAIAFWAAGTGMSGAPSFSPDGGMPRLGRPARFNLLLLGAVVAELGFVACAPALVGLVGRLAGRLPLAPRLALRDAARNRSRSGPAVAAVVAAVAGSVAVSVYLASDVDRQRRNYRARLPHGVVEIQDLGYDGERLSAANRVAAIAAMPVAREIAVGQPGHCRVSAPCDYWQVAAPTAAGCPPGTDPKSNAGCAAVPFGAGVVVTDPDYVDAADGRPGDVVDDAVVVFDPRLVDEGHVTLLRERYVDSAGRPLPQPETTRIRLPGVVVEAAEFANRPSAVVPPSLARAHGIPARRTATWLTTTRMPTTRDVDRARGAGGGMLEMYVERGFVAQNKLALLALLAASALVTIGATGIATGLAAADSRPDLATLAAVGAAPRVRRVLAMAQAATVAALGSAMGVLAGLVPAVAVIGARAEFELAVPWVALATTALGVPALAALLVGALSRSRLPLERRLA